MDNFKKEDLAVIKPDCVAGVAVAEKAAAVGYAKANLPLGKTFVLAILAGMFIGCGALFMTFVKADQTLSFAVANMLGGLAFSLGLVCVIVAGSELFTGNTLMVIGALDGKFSWSQLLKNWVVVWCGNLVGSLMLVCITVGCGLMGTEAGDNTIGAQMVAIASAKENLDVMQIIFRGIMCNFLVCLAVWMGYCGRTVIDKVFTSIFPVMAFVAMGFEHCVANMFILSMGTVASAMGFGGVALGWGGIVYNICFATIGNIIGGAVFVGILYWLAYRK